MECRLRSFLKHPGTQAALAWLIGTYLKLVLRSIRWTFVGEEHLDSARAKPIIFVAWHEDLPLMPAVWARLRRRHRVQRRIVLLASRSRDGRMIGAVMRRFGADITAGSSSKGGRAALRSLLDTLRGGDHVGIIPDGPRGPRRHAGPGFAQLAGLSGAPVLPCGGHVSRGLTLRSWDRMQIPAPFAHGVIVVGAPYAVPRDRWRNAVPALEWRLRDVADRARGLADPTFVPAAENE